jgi:hypothetical protein
VLFFDKPVGIAILYNGHMFIYELLSLLLESFVIPADDGYSRGLFGYIASLGGS